MHRILRLRRGNTAVTSTFVGAAGEVTIDTTKQTLVVHDGTTPGGHPMSNGVVTANVSAEPPLNPVSGQLWIDTDNGIEYVFYDDGVNPGQWTEFGNTGGRVYPNKLVTGDLAVVLDSSGNLRLPIGGDILNSRGESVLTYGNQTTLINGSHTVILGADGKLTLSTGGTIEFSDNSIQSVAYTGTAFPTQTSNNGKYLTTNGTSLSWGTVATQIQSDWTQATNTALDYIKNKPTLATVATSGSYTDLSNRPTIPVAQIRSDWNAATGLAVILNKPSIPSIAGLATTGYVDTAVSNLVNSAPAALDTLKELADALGNNASFSTTVSTALGNRLRVDINTQGLTGTQQGFARTNLGLATVASTGSYTDLTSTPTLFSGSYADLTSKPTLFSGNYYDLSNKPSIPPLQIRSNWTQTDNTALDYIANKPIVFSGSYADLSGKPDLFNGSYLSLTNRPTIPTDNEQLANSAGYLTRVPNPISGDASVGDATMLFWDGAWRYTNNIKINPATGLLTLTGVSGVGGIKFPDASVQTTAYTGVFTPADGDNVSGSADLIFYDGSWNYTSRVTINPVTSMLTLNGNSGTGGITFPDATVQTTAYTSGGSGGTLDSVTTTGSTTTNGITVGSLTLTDGYSIEPGEGSLGIVSPDNVAIITDDGNSNQLWLFGTDGVLTLPTGGVIAEGVVTDNPTIQLTPATPDVASQKLVIKGGGTVDHHLHLTTGDLAETSIFLGTDDHNVRTTLNGNIEITTPNTVNNVWEFRTDGSLKFPRDAVTNTDPILTIVGGETPTITSTHASLAGPANLAMSVDYLNISGSNGKKIVAYPDQGVLAADDNMVLITNFADQANNSAWTFGTDGVLTVPGGGGVWSIGAGTVGMTANIVSGNAYIGLDDTSSVATLYGNAGVQIGTNTNVSWDFNAAGVLSIPQGGDITRNGVSVLGGGTGVPAWTSAGAITLTATTTNPTKGTTTADNISYRQLGAKQWEVVMTYIQTATNGTTGSGDYLVTLPNSLSFDTTLPSQQIWTGWIGNSVWDHLTYVIPSGSGLITQGSIGGQVYPMVYNATKFRILTTTWNNAIRCWGSGYYSAIDVPKIQLTFRFTST